MSGNTKLGFDDINVGDNIIGKKNEIYVLLNKSKKNDRLGIDKDSYSYESISGKHFMSFDEPIPGGYKKTKNLISTDMVNGYRTSINHLGMYKEIYRNASASGNTDGALRVLNGKYKDAYDSSIKWIDEIKNADSSFEVSEKNTNLINDYLDTVKQAHGNTSSSSVGEKNTSEDIDDIIRNETDKWNKESEAKRKKELDEELKNINDKFDAELKEEFKAIDREKKSGNRKPDEDIVKTKQQTHSDSNKKSNTSHNPSEPKASNHVEYKETSRIKTPTVVNEVDDVLLDSVNKAESITGFTNKFAKGAIGLIAGASLLHAGMNHLEDKKAEKMMKEQNKKIDKQRQEEYEETVRRRNATEGMYYNLNQQLFANRTGHTNTWGGKRY